MEGLSRLTPDQSSNELARLLEDNFSKTPAVKVSLAGGKGLTSSEFWNLIIDFASRLDATSHKASRVAIIGKRSVYLMAMVGACIYLKRPFTIIDPAAPEVRKAEVLELFDPSVLVLTDGSELALQEASFADRTRNNTICHGATYVVFTSGSSGTPKGVVVGPESYLPFVQWITNELNLSASDTISMINPPHFDNFIADISLFLFTNARGFVFSDPLPASRELQHELRISGVTHWFSVPSTLRYLMTLKIFNPTSISNMSWCSFGGEPFLTSEIRKLKNLVPIGCELVNVYGPSETTCISSFYRVTDSDLDSSYPYPPIGKMNYNFDAGLIEVNSDGVGELILSGGQVGRGYVDGSSRGFFQSTTPASNLRSYKTGDLMWQNEAGQFHFVSRVDRQIKIMGHRIEPGEVESIGLRDQRVNEILVTQFVSFGSATLGCAFSGDLTREDLNRHFQENLPPHLVPRGYIKFDHLPRNRNGKVDNLSIVEALGGLGRV